MRTAGKEMPHKHRTNILETEKPVNAPAFLLSGGIAPPPCFFWRLCSQRADMEKAGRSLCRGCAARIRGAEYPLRNASLQPIYLTGREAAEALDMVEA
jgi:hypothetical protein